MPYPSGDTPGDTRSRTPRTRKEGVRARNAQSTQSTQKGSNTP